MLARQLLQRIGSPRRSSTPTSNAVRSSIRLLAPSAGSSPSALRHGGAHGRGRLLRRFALSLALVAVCYGLASGAPPNASARSAQCSATRAIFYTSSSWLSLAQALAADSSSCAQYYIDIDPLAASKTTMRSGAASQVDALGPNFHAVAEVNFGAWQNWVIQTGSSWFQAGQQARANMDAAGFNVANGDTWAVNEFPSDVLTNAGGLRQDVEQLVQGLYAGGGNDPPCQGIVYMIGVGQTGNSFAQYKANLESWFQDQTFWSIMSTDVSDFMFEAYGDVRDYAIEGTTPAARIALLNSYLEAPLELVTAPGSPAAAETARSYLTSAYGPLANADWAWTEDYGWTEVPSSVMADYVSAETYAMRSSNGGIRIGFAWNPSNTLGIDTSDFDADSAGILARLAGSIAETDEGDPAEACEATGCAAVVSDSDPVTAWNAFASWTPTVAAFQNPPLTTRVGNATRAFALELQTGGIPTTLPNASTVTLSSNSESETFSTSADGPWSPTLTLSLPPGDETTAFYALDSQAGSPTISASLDGAISTQTETVVPTPQAAPPPEPPALVTSLAFTPSDGRMHIEVRVVDGSGQALPANVGLSLLLGSQTIATTSGATSPSGYLGMTAFPLLERGCYRVLVTQVDVSGYRWNGVSPNQSYCVTSLPAKLTSLTLGTRHGHLHLELSVEGSGHPLQARVSASLLRGGKLLAEGVGPTSADGHFGLTAEATLEPGCYSARVDTLSAPGYSWNHVSPSAHLCLR